MLSSLPNEIWQEIFQWATTSHVDEYTSKYAPFSGAPSALDDNLALPVKSALVLVCRLWHNLTTEMLYKDVKIARTPSQESLRGALANGNGGYGRMVRRAVLPFDSTVTNRESPHSSESVEILRMCPQLEVLIRPRAAQFATRTLTFEYDAESITLPCLRRLEWWHHNDAERSGGINSLSNVLDRAPNLEYLFVGGAVGMHSMLFESGNLVLPKLHTLRLFAVSGLMLRQLCSRIELPALEHVVLDCVVPRSDMQNFWEAHNRIQTVEFGKHLRFMLTDEVSPCLEACTNIRDINFYAFFTTPPTFTGTNDAVRSVGWNSAVNYTFDDDNAWEYLKHHMAFILSEALPSLEQLVLFGSWDEYLCRTEFQTFRRQLQERRCQLTLSA
ncbi:hypothetical protein CYLTODRAFT_365583 [Cylindrobasidium torrendii FP15055 ss-10]|uniref:Uncharacterized protein n=1 Tax=Cylindrobasidium torrendii FP15055 ss-10 TaxID=1314674 RepID=A0A0D7BSZ1_9AGAR|nr:hypothetical protein CYLTODRAFT_365583 [Cylindrobasidium torrendii FP15055 ss-10]